MILLMNWKKGIMQMNSYQICITPRAKTDIIEIGDYIRDTLLEPDISKHFIIGLRHSISQLKYFPYKCPLVQDEDLQKQYIHCMPYRNYYVFYQIIEKQQLVLVLRVGYNRRNWKGILP